MRKKFMKSGVSLLVCLALLFSVASTTAFAKPAGEETHNYQVRNGVYLGFDSLSYESYDLVGKFSVDTANFEEFAVKKFSVAYTLHGEWFYLGDFPSDSFDIRINARTNCQDSIRFMVVMYGDDGQQSQVEATFDLRQFLDDGIWFAEPIFGGNHEILVNYGSYDLGSMTYTYNGYTSEPHNRPGGSGVFPLMTFDPEPGSILEIKVVLRDYPGARSCELIRTYQY